DLPHLPGVGRAPRVRPAGPRAPRHLGRAQRVRAPTAPGPPRRLTGSLPGRQAIGRAMGSAMTAWEYATVPLLPHNTKQILDNWGDDGWELVAVHTAEVGGTVAFFKRAKAGAAARCSGAGRRRRLERQVEAEHPERLAVPERLLGGDP